MSSSWNERMWQLLREGPQPVEQLLAETTRLVPPGLAWREREYKRKHSAMREGLSIREREVTDQAIMVGQRSVVRSAISKLVSSKRAKYIEVDGQQGVELLPYEDPAIKSERGRQLSHRFWDGMSPEERHAFGMRTSAAKTPEQRSEASRRGWKTRRANSANS